MFEKFNEYRDKSDYEKQQDNKKVFLIAAVSLLFIAVRAYGVILWMSL